jgi:hypothetical protein
MSEVNQKDTYVRFFGQSNKKAKQQAKQAAKEDTHF